MDRPIISEFTYEAAKGMVCAARAKFSSSWGAASRAAWRGLGRGATQTTK